VAGRWWDRAPARSKLVDISAVPVWRISITRLPSGLRYALTFSAGSTALASTRSAPGRMNRLYAAIAHSRFDTW
jgi:hypothetical protein